MISHVVLFGPINVNIVAPVGSVLTPTGKNRARLSWQLELALFFEANLVQATAEAVDAIIFVLTS